jgi:hypothetical protein
VLSTTLGATRNHHDRLADEIGISAVIAVGHLSDLHLVVEDQKNTLLPLMTRRTRMVIVMMERRVEGITIQSASFGKSVLMRQKL